MDAPLEFDTFAPRQRETFQLRLGDRTVPAELIEAKATGAAQPGARQPFTLLFRIARDLVPPQRIYRLEHEELDALELFLVPIGPDAEGQRLEAVIT